MQRIEFGQEKIKLGLVALPPWSDNIWLLFFESRLCNIKQEDGLKKFMSYRHRKRKASTLMKTRDLRFICSPVGRIFPPSIGPPNLCTCTQDQQIEAVLCYSGGATSESYCVQMNAAVSTMNVWWIWICCGIVMCFHIEPPWIAFWIN